MNEDLIKKQIKSGEFAKLYLLYGEEGFLKSYYCGQIARRSVSKGMESFNLHRFDGDNFSVPQFISALNNMPLMSKYKCIVLRNIDFDGIKAAEWKEFSGTLKDIPDGTIVVVHYDSQKAEKKSSRFRALQALARQNGVEAEIKKPARRELEKWVLKIVSAHGCTIRRETLSCFFDTCGDDMNVLKNEAEKICAYTAGGEIEQRQIEELGVKPLNSSVYDLAKKIAAGKAGAGLKLIDEYFYRKEDPILILSALSGAFCDLYRARAALDSGLGQQEILQDFDYRGKEFRVKNALRDCRSMSSNHLSRCISLLSEADKKLKSSRADKRLVLEQLIVEMCGGTRQCL